MNTAFLNLLFREMLRARNEVANRAYKKRGADGSRWARAAYREWIGLKADDTLSGINDERFRSWSNQAVKAVWSAHKRRLAALGCQDAEQFLLKKCRKYFEEQIAERLDFRLDELTVSVDAPMKNEDGSERSLLDLIAGDNPLALDGNEESDFVKLMRLVMLRIAPPDQLGVVERLLGLLNDLDQRLSEKSSSLADTFFSDFPNRVDLKKRKFVIRRIRFSMLRDHASNSGLILSTDDWNRYFIIRD